MPSLQSLQADVPSLHLSLRLNSFLPVSGNLTPPHLLSLDWLACCRNVKLSAFSPCPSSCLLRAVWAHLCICTVGSYASLSVCLSGCLSVCLSVCDLTKIQTRQKVTRQKFISQEPFDLWSPNFAWWWTLRFDLEVKGHMGQGQSSHGSRSKVTWVKVKWGFQTKAGGLTTTSSCFISALADSIVVWAWLYNSHTMVWWDLN